MKSSTVLALFLAISSTAWAEKKLYTNNKVYRLTPNNAASLEILKSLENEPLSGLNFWSPVTAVGVPVDVMVPPDQEERVSSIVTKTGMSSSLFIRDVQELIDNEVVRKVARAGDLDWESYHTLDEIYDWLNSLAETYPDTVTLLNVGKTYEGRDILGVKVSFNAANENRAVFIESNIHAREWITSAVSTHILNEFLTSNDTDIRGVADNHDWYFFPIANPDGFEYTHTDNRLWRKTRVPYTAFCVGSDPNRNWGYHWLDGGASTNPCSDTYAGPSAFSEPSTKALSEYITTISSNLLGFIGFHSYSQLLLLPYGHTTDHLDNYDETLPIGQTAMEVLSERYGTQYRTGNVAETIYVASGGSMDWVKGTYGTPVVYTYELRDTGRYGFLLPPEQIVPTSLETLDSLLSIFGQWKALHPEQYT